MTRLQDDVLNIYNSLTEFSDMTLSNEVPINVYYEEGLNSLCFEQKGKKIAVSVLNYYCENLKNIKNSYLLPGDYDKLMSSLSVLIGSGIMLHDRVCVSPEKYGFQIYETSGRSFKDGPVMMADIKFISGDSWIFNKYIKIKYKNII